MKQDTPQANTFYADFVIEVLKAAKLTEADGSLDEQYVHDLAGELEKSMGIMIASELSSDDVATYVQMTQTPDTPADELGAFLRDHIEQFAEKRQKVFDDFTFRVMEQAQSIREALQ